MHLYTWSRAFSIAGWRIVREKVSNSRGYRTSDAAEESSWWLFLNFTIFHSILTFLLTFLQLYRFPRQIFQLFIATAEIFRNKWLNLDFFSAFILDFLKLSINKLFTHTDKSCIFREDLMFDRLINGLLLFISNFYIVHVIFDLFVILCRILQVFYYFTVSHLVYKWNIRRFRIDFNVGLERNLV